MPLSITAWNVSLPYLQRHQTAKITTSTREIIVLEVIENEKQWSAEFSPLPPFSEESLEDVRQVLPDLAGWLETWIPFENPAKAEESIPEEWPNSIKWGVSRMIWSNTLDKEPEENNKQHQVTTHALLSPGDEANALKNWNGNSHAFKVKIHPASWQPLMQTMASFQEQYPNTRWVLDANEQGSLAWLDELQQWCQDYQFDAIQYVEDPLTISTPEEAKELITQSPIRLGFDEFLQPRRRQDRFEFSDGIKSLKGGVFVIKPALFGSISEIEHLTQFASKADVPVVFSTLMESTLGRSFTMYAARRFGSTVYTHGLDTGHLFAVDFALPPTDIHQTFESLPDNPMMCYSKTALL